MKKNIILVIVVIGLSTGSIAGENCKSGTKQQAAAKCQSGTAKKAGTQSKPVIVKNEKVFAIPAKQQKMLGVKTVKLAKDAKGLLQVPNTSIQNIQGKTAIFLSLGENKFALRYIKVDKKKAKYSLVSKNVLEHEIVVTDGAAKLKAGVLRMLSNSHKGHAHGPGGHAR
jgi:hypothetical protein